MKRDLTRSDYEIGKEVAYYSGWLEREIDKVLPVLHREDLLADIKVCVGLKYVLEAQLKCFSQMIQVGLELSVAHPHDHYTLSNEYYQYFLLLKSEANRYLRQFWTACETASTEIKESSAEKGIVERWSNYIYEILKDVPDTYKAPIKRTLFGPAWKFWEEELKRRESEK